MGFSLKKIGKGISQGVSDVVATAATGTFEYTTLKPIEAVADKVVNFSGRAAGLAGKATQVLTTAQGIARDNPGLVSLIPGAAGFSSVLGGASGGGESVGYDGSGFATASPKSNSMWLIAAGVAVAMLLAFVLFKKKG